MKLIATNKTIAAVTLLSATTPFLVSAEHGCGKRDGHDVAIVSKTASDASGLASAFDVFTNLLGGVNNGSGPAQVSGHRSINWDAGIVPFDMPGDFFASTVPRGLTVVSDRNEFRVSNPDDDSDDLFDSINKKASQKFQTFSSPRLFSPVRDNEIEIVFSPAGENRGGAAVNGFGAIFVDVDKSHTTIMTFFDKHGCVLAEKAVKPHAGGLSFLGVAFGEDNHEVYKVHIELGNKPLDRKDGSGKSGKSGKSGGNLRNYDFVVLDDFIYGEPQKLV